MKAKRPDITPEDIYLSRRLFVKKMGAAGAGAALILAGCDRLDERDSSPPPRAQRPGRPESGVDERGDRLTAYEAVIGYNNFYEFTTDKEDVADIAAGFRSKPWTVEVGGLVDKPQTYEIDGLIAKFGEEERIYRMRCVEGWSMIIPWLGFPLHKLLRRAGPHANAKYVRFTAVYDPQRLPGQKSSAYTWPYVEGLRLDEAMNDLALLATGLYGKPLLPQSGAPIRLVVPWKYGYKSIKSIVRIDLVEKMPLSLWMQAAPDQYGFFANVNPDVAHKRWSQSSERRIGEVRRRRTLSMNGYAKEIADLYKGMDLKRFY